MNTENLIKISFNEAVQNHKDLVNKSVWMMRNSETDNSDVFPIYDIVWFYSFLFMKIDTIDELLQIWNMNFEDRVKEELKHTIVNFCMTTPEFSVMFKLTDIPEKVEEMVRKKVKQRMYIESLKESNDINFQEKGPQIKVNDIWDDTTLESSIEELKIVLQEAIDAEDYESAADIQKQIDLKTKGND